MAFLASADQRFCSSITNFVVSSALAGIGDTPNVAYPSLISGWPRISEIAVFSLWMRSGGTPLGAATTNHWLASKPGTPASSKVGTLGSASTREAVETA
ncbi:hypothetical protein D9M73_297220 [compost metagenome]